MRGGLCSSGSRGDCQERHPQGIANTSQLVEHTKPGDEDEVGDLLTPSKTIEQKLVNSANQLGNSLSQLDYDISSDSTLSDPPSDLDLESEDESPYFSNPGTPSKPRTSPIKNRQPTKSPYFTSPRVQRITCLPFPPLTYSTFGLMQEKLANDPFRLLVATIFLNRTRGEQAMPVYFQLMERFPTVEALAAADPEEIVCLIHKLGFQNQRARRCIELAKAWLSKPPRRGRRYRKLNYPQRGDGRDVKAEEILHDDDGRVGWEIAHLPGLGAYALDSWRIFCRDKLRGLATSWNGEGATMGFEPEWKRVVPLDKELRAYLTWSFLKTGLIWNKQTGETRKADETLLKNAQDGGVVHEDGDYLILTSSVNKVSGTRTVEAIVEHPAGDFMPD